MAKKKPLRHPDSPVSQSQDVTPNGPGVSGVAQCSYIAEGLRHLAVSVDSLVLDPRNVKEHGDIDLPAHQASLREFGIRRAIVARKENRQVIAGNGTLLAAIKNGWTHVPVLFTDDDQKTARAYALADNAVGMLAPWNEETLQALQAEIDLFDEAELKGTADQISLQLGGVFESEQTEQPEPEKPASGDVMFSRRVIAVCETEEKQVQLMNELKNRGFECRLNTVVVK